MHVGKQRDRHAAAARPPRQAAEVAASITRTRSQALSEVTRHRPKQWSWNRQPRGSGRWSPSPWSAEPEFSLLDQIRTVNRTGGVAHARSQGARALLTSEALPRTAEMVAGLVGGVAAG